MQSKEEIIEMLRADLNCSISVIKKKPTTELYYNKYFEDVSWKLVALLEIHLRQNGNEWDPAKWMDDCLITDVWITETDFSLGGIAIWGIGPSKQWTEPFFFEVPLKGDQVDFGSYTFLFGDMDREPVIYKAFNKKRYIWEQDERDWQYIIEVR